MRPFLFVAATMAALAQQPSDFFPLQTGNAWVYRVSGRVAATPVTMTVLEPTEVSGNTYFEVTGVPAIGRALLRYNETGTLVALDSTTSTEIPWLVFRAATGEAFESRVHPCVASASVTSRDGKGDFPVGSLSDVLTVDYGSFTCADAGITSDSFAPDLGLVRRVETTIAGPRTYDLVYARVAGNTVLTQPEQSYSLSLGRLIYEEDQPLTMLARITLRNTTATPLELNFTSGQTYNFVIRNAAGEGVYNWAADKLFVQQIRNLKVQGEKVWAETFTVPTKLAPGMYTLESVLTTAPIMNYKAQIAFQVRAAAAR